jgi:hypothetical protein
MASKFGDADGLGFACGKRSGITVLDVDSPDERRLADALNRYGPSPFIVRSGSGNYQAWYRHNGEGRQIRPDDALPLDILGGGYVVAPPSRALKGNYSIIEGSLSCLADLPTLRAQLIAGGPLTALQDNSRIARGQRNQSLWRECMKRARQCLDLEQLMGFAMTANQTMLYEPLPDEEVLRIVASAWAKETSGDNMFGRSGRVIISAEQIDHLLTAFPDAFILLTLLRRHHWGRDFVCANAMAATMPGGGWSRQRFAAARQKLEEIGEIRMVRPASKQSGPATYRFKAVSK